MPAAAAGAYVEGIAAATAVVAVVRMVAQPLSWVVRPAQRVVDLLPLSSLLRQR